MPGSKAKLRMFAQEELDDKRWYVHFVQCSPELTRFRSHFGWSWLELGMLRFSRAQLGTQLGYLEAVSGRCRRRLFARKSVTEAGLEVVPGDGIEPPTRGFSVRCSTD
jgi:hypothetical protein